MRNLGDFLAAIFFVLCMLFYILVVASAYAADKTCTFGLPTDTPVIGDWNGDGRDEIGVKRGNVWYLDTDGDCKWTPEPAPDPPPAPIPVDVVYIPFKYPSGSDVIKFGLTPGASARFYFEVKAYSRDPLIVKVEDYCDGAMVHQMDTLVRYSGKVCDGKKVPTVQDIKDTWTFCRQYAAQDGCRLHWINSQYSFGGVQVPRYKDFYYDLTSTGFETITVAGDPASPTKDNPIGCYLVIVHNDDVVNTCPGLSLQDF